MGELATIASVSSYCSMKNPCISNLLGVPKEGDCFVPAACVHFSYSVHLSEI